MIAVPHVLLLGGTAESGLLADELGQAFPGWKFTVTNNNEDEGAGVSSPSHSDSDGVFASSSEMGEWIHENQVVAVIDATMASSSALSRYARKATEGGSAPLLVLRRPSSVASTDVSDELAPGLVEEADGEGRDVAESVPEALLWLASVSAELSRSDAQRREDAAHSERSGQAAAALNAMGWHLTGDIATVCEALDNGEPVDVDNPAGWPLPDLSSALSPDHAQVKARILVSDMAPTAAMQFSDGAPTLIITPRSLVIGVSNQTGVSSDEAIRGVRAVLDRHLLAAEAVAGIAPVSGSDDAWAAKVADGLGGHVMPAAGEDPEGAVTHADARVVLPSTLEGGVLVAVGRIAPQPR